MLKIENLTKYYGSFKALDNINIEINEGITGILGANGAGKSTLLNLITDNIKRSSGAIYYNDKEILNEGASYRKKVGYTPQLQGLYEDFTAGQFVRYIGSLKGMKHSECKKQTSDMLNIVGLGDYETKRLSGFSGGMRQRVLLAAAMLDNPEILILDEPTAGLDPEERIRLRNYIAEIAEDKIVLLATHIVSDIECVAEKVIVLHHGEVVKYASPTELMDGISGFVGEKEGSYEELNRMREKYKKGQIIRRRSGFVMRLSDKELPEDFNRVSDISLEDVYLYYSE